MEVEIVPEPGPAEWEALLEALASEDGDSEQPYAYRSPWRRAGLDFAEDELEPLRNSGLYATARRLSSPGASRA